MWMLKSAVYLAVVHIAGDNIAVVPDMAAELGYQIIITVILAYIVLGAGIAGILAWIGVTTGYELNRVVTNLFGCRGKKYLAFITLMVCIPASALTGGYFTGAIIQTMFDVPNYISIPLFLLIVSLLAVGIGNELLKLSNYLGLLLIPMICILFLLSDIPFKPLIFTYDSIDWVLVLALAGYNIGGMHSLLVVETSACLLKKRHKTIYLSIFSKVIEGLVTLSLAYLVIITDTCGPLALLSTANKIFAAPLSYLVSIIMLCIFLNTMAPAMVVNAKQLRILTKLPVVSSLFLSGILVWALSFFHYHKLLLMISIGTVGLIIFIIFTVHNLHKHRVIK